MSKAGFDTAAPLHVRRLLNVIAGNLYSAHDQMESFGKRYALLLDGETPDTLEALRFALSQPVTQAAARRAMREASSANGNEGHGEYASVFVPRTSATLPEDPFQGQLRV